MALFKLPRLDQFTNIVANLSPTITFQGWWAKVANAIEGAINNIQAALDAAATAQATADTADTNATSASAEAATALAASGAAQTTANTAVANAAAAQGTAATGVADAAAAQATANAAMPKAGGAFTGGVTGTTASWSGAVGNTGTYQQNNASADVPAFNQLRSGTVQWTLGGFGHGSSWGLKNNIQPRPAIKFDTVNAAVFDRSVSFENDPFFTAGYDSGVTTRPKFNWANNAGIVFDTGSQKFIFYIGATAVFSIGAGGVVKALSTITPSTAP